MERSGSRSPPSAVDDPAAVGPVLTPGPLADAVIAAIRADNAGVAVLDRGAYLRVLVTRRCRVGRARVESLAQAAFHLPADLEAIMPSFRGRLTITDDEAVWDVVERKAS